jgi:hypothetical protein
MTQLTHEIRREYRLNFNRGEPEWDDPISPDVTSDVLGRRTGTVINRTSLLAWSLMNLPCVEVADLVGGGWMEIRLNIDPDFDELNFQFQVAELVASVRDIRAHRVRAKSSWTPGVRDLAAAVMNKAAVRPNA